MISEDTYGIGFFLAGTYHLLCHEGEEYRFHPVMQHSCLKPVKLTYYAARQFIETHPVCSNISNHDIRIMPYREIENILQGRSAESQVKSLALSGEEEQEEPLH